MKAVVSLLMTFFAMMALLTLSSCALFRSVEDNKRIESEKAYRREAEEKKQRKADEARKMEEERLAYQAANPPESPEESSLDEICDTTNALFKYALKLDDEHKVAKASGSLNLSSTNELGFKVMNNHRKLMDQMTEFKKSFGKDPDINRCTSVTELSENDSKRAEKVIKQFAESK
jgi:hypothetical protein